MTLAGHMTMKCVAPVFLNENHGGDCLNRLAQAHFVAEKGFLLMQHVFHVQHSWYRRKSHSNPFGKEALFLNFFGKVFRKPIHGIAIAQQSRNDFFKSIGI